MRVVSLVVEGFERAQGDGLLEWLWQQDADVICLQDTRCSEYSLRDDGFFPSDYNAYFWDDFEDHSRNGVAIYCRKLPKAIMTGLGFTEFDSKGLYIQADYPNLSVGSLLMPSGLSGTEAMATKLQFMEQLGAHLQKVRNKRRDFILCGGWELVHQPIDAEDAGNRDDLPGFGKDERVWLNSLYNSGYCDAFREVNKEPDEYSWWPDGDDGGGLRSDTHIISDSLRSRVERAVIYTADVFSGHSPVIIDYDTEV
jgi:exodeoxyribonuclease-3